MMGIPGIFCLLFVPVLAIYGLIILAFTGGLLKRRSRNDLSSRQFTNFVSVIVPVRNEEGNILRILDEIGSQDFPAAFMEVIVTDDYSEDETVAFVNRYTSRDHHFPVVIVRPGSDEQGVGHTGKKRAIERAVEKARGEILLFTDADTSRGPGWISSMVSCFRSPGIQMVLGPVCFSGEHNLLQKIQSLEFMGLMGTTAGSAALGFPVMCNGANLAYPRSAFYEAGGFSGNLRFGSGDDQFMMSAIRKKFGKGSLIFNDDPSSIVSTQAEATLSGFFNQRIRWVSKSRGYRDPLVIIVGLITYLTHFMLLAGMLVGFFFPSLLAISILFWLGKILVDYPMVWIMSRIFRKKNLAGYYFIAQVFQLVYVTVAGLFGLFLTYRWKGRTG